MRLQAARWRQYAASTPSSPVVRFNLREKLPVLLGEAFKWYPRYMLEKRAKAAVEKGVKTEIAVMDGNMTLAGRICARAHAEVEHSEVRRIADVSRSLLQSATCFQEAAVYAAH
eukprot:s853_g16.t1